MKTKRVKMIHLRAEEMLGLFIEPRVDMDDGCACLVTCWTTFPGLPEGLEVHAVNWDVAYQRWALLLSHPSFPEVESGCMIPIIPGQVATATVRKRYVAEESWRDRKPLC